MYEPTIGLEIHTELKTKTKMFCGCLNDAEEKHPNVNVCQVCLAHPGVLPTINKKAVESVLKLGLALNSQIPETSKFDRKNYFYPDLPKGYQISQYDKPLALGGVLEFRIQNSEFRIKITRIHLEEDTGRLVHSADGKSSLVDFNRAGVPLMELVTEPDIKSSEQAVKFAKELKLIMRYLGISDADMEKGQMRVEVNISMAKAGERGTKVEIKNLNSFRAVGESIDYEIKRQSEVLERGEKIKQETCGWNDVKKHTVSQRSKEEAHDYRYFPEPDLPLMDLTKFDLENLKIELPILPAEKRSIFMNEYKLSANQVEILVSERNLAKYFEEAASELAQENPGTNYQILFNYLTSDLRGLMNQNGISFGEQLKISQGNLAHLVVLIESGTISSRMAKDMLLEMFKTGVDPHIMIEKGLFTQVSDEGKLKATVEEVIKENPKAVEDYKKGKENALQFLVGQAMGKLKGQAKPEVLNEIFRQLLTRVG